MKNSLEGFNSRSDQVEEKKPMMTGHLNYWVKRTKEKRLKKSGYNLKNRALTVMRICWMASICIMWIPAEEKEKGTKNLKKIISQKLFKSQERHEYPNTRS